MHTSSLTGAVLSAFIMAVNVERGELGFVLGGPIQSPQLVLP